MWNVFLLRYLGYTWSPVPFVCLMTLLWEHQFPSNKTKTEIMEIVTGLRSETRESLPSLSSQHELPRPVFLWITRCLKIDQWSTSEWAGISGPRKMSEITKDGGSWKVKTKTREQQAGRWRKDMTRWTGSQKRGFNPGLISSHHHHHHHCSDPADDEDDSYLTELSGLHHCYLHPSVLLCYSRWRDINLFTHNSVLGPNPPRKRLQERTGSQNSVLWCDGNTTSVGECFGL